MPHNILGNMESIVRTTSLKYPFKTKVFKSISVKFRSMNRNRISICYYRFPPMFHFLQKPINLVDVSNLKMNIISFSRINEILLKMHHFSSLGSKYFKIYDDCIAFMTFKTLETEKFLDFLETEKFLDFFKVYNINYASLDFAS